MKQNLSAAAVSMRSKIAGYFCPALGNALNSLTGTEFQVGILDSGDFEKPEDTIIWRQPFSLAAGASLWLVAGKNLWEAVGRMILGGPGVESVPDDDCRSTWHEISGQTMSGIAQALSADLAREVLAQGGEPDFDGPGGHVQEAVLEIRNSMQIWHLRIFWNSQFAAAFPVPASSQAAAHSSGAQEATVSKTLELLLEVALPVSVSFGKTSLQLREVLKLNTGSVVELDRLVSEPVEVIVNNCVIARGEVVVVDGNYGVRVLHLASRADRLRSGMSEASSRLSMGAR
jgi:flagellar motor switch protein FliN/FliY